MKNLFFLVCLCAFSLTNMNAQTKVAIIDVNGILESITDYKNAQTELDRLAEQWKQDIARDRNEIADLYSKYQAEEVMLSEAQRKTRQDEITGKEKAMMEKQRAKFGNEGELFKRRQSLVKPIQDRVYKEIQGYAQENGIDLVFDKGATGLLFANDTYDKTSDIQKRLNPKN